MFGMSLKLNTYGGGVSCAAFFGAELLLRDLDLSSGRLAGLQHDRWAAQSTITPSSMQPGAVDGWHYE